MHFFLQEKTELSSQCISCQAVKMTNIHITATSLLLSWLSTKSICQKFSVKLKYGKENSRNHCERWFPAGERKIKINHKLNTKLSHLQIFTWMILIPGIKKKLFLNPVCQDNQLPGGRHFHMLKFCTVRWPSWLKCVTKKSGRKNTAFL